MAAKPSFELRLRVLNAVYEAPGTTMRERIKHVATRPFADILSGHTYQFTWRTISTWLYRHKKHGIATLENQTRSDKNTYRKVQLNQLAEAIHEVLPSRRSTRAGSCPKASCIACCCNADCSCASNWRRRRFTACCANTIC